MSHLRRKRLINRNVQIGLTGSFIAIAAVCAVLQAVLLNGALNGLAADLGEPEAFQGALPLLLGKNLALTIGTLLATMWLFGVFITHRVAGPAYHFERYLEGIARGEYDGPCKVREGDELQELCDQINAAVERLRTDAQARDAEPERAA